MTRIDAEKLQNHAKSNRWSARQIAKEAGLSDTGVHLVLKGKVDPSATALKKICDVIGFPIEEAFIDDAFKLAA